MARLPRPTLVARPIRCRSGPRHLRQPRPALGRPITYSLTVVVTLLASLAVLSFSVAAAEEPTGDDKASKCVLTPGKWASPTELWLGERTLLTLTTTTRCPATLIPLHVVLAIDSSNSMEPENKLQNAQAAARRFVDRMDLKISKIGVTSFSDKAYVNCELTDKRGRAAGAINGLELKFGTDIEGGLDVSREVLTRGRTRNVDPDLPAPTEIVIILSDGRPWPRAQNPLAAASRIKSQKILLASVCVGSNCDTGLMRNIASRPDLFFDVRDSSRLLGVYDRLANQFLDTQLRALKIVDELPGNMRYIDTSAIPEPSSVASDTLEWALDVIPSDGVTITYEVEPLEAGVWPTNRLAIAEFRDTNDGIGHVQFPTPTVKVLVPPSATPTCTPEPTPTPTDAPPTPTCTATATATVAPTPVPVPLFLPVLLNEHCDPLVVDLDVVLVIDISSSMRWPTRERGTPKREAARRAARAFVRQLKPGGDRVAIVYFGDSARVAVSLTDDHEAAIDALQELPEQVGTRIDAGLRVAHQILARRDRQGQRDAAVLLLTDGCPTRSSEAQVRSSATSIRRAGIPIYAVGLGVDVKEELLLDLAGDPNRYVSAPDAEDLVRIYRGLVRVISCPAGRHDWSQPWP